MSQPEKNNSKFNVQQGESRKALIPKDNVSAVVNTHKQPQSKPQQQAQRKTSSASPLNKEKPSVKQNSTVRQAKSPTKSAKNVTNKSNKNNTKNQIKNRAVQKAPQRATKVAQRIKADKSNTKKKQPNELKKKTNNQTQTNKKNSKIQNTKGQSTKANNKKSAMKMQLDRSILDLLLIRKSVYSIKGNVHIGYLLKDKKYMNLFGVLSQDYPNLSETDIGIQASNFDMTYRIYNKSLKFFGLNMVVDTRKNVNYFETKMKKTSKRAYKAILRSNIEELQNLNVQSKQFYAMVFADSYEELVEKNSIIVSHLCSAGLLRPLLAEEKEEVLKKLNNPFSYVT